MSIHGFRLDKTAFSLPIIKLIYQKENKKGKKISLHKVKLLNGEKPICKETLEIIKWLFNKWSKDENYNFKITPTMCNTGFFLLSKENYDLKEIQIILITFFENLEYLFHDFNLDSRYVGEITELSNNLLESFWGKRI